MSQPTTDPVDFKALQLAINDCLLPDRQGLQRRLAGLQRRARQGKPVDRGLTSLAADIDASRSRLSQRRARLPVPAYPAELPVVEQREHILAAIEQHQVVIVSGETGSGKTTQLPKLCVELGRGAAGMIGHTQPRRIAARSLSSRIAEELHTEVGQGVGFKVRFSDHVSDQTWIKVMTDGILLAETQGDPDLLAYDTIIIDEAHERSLNIDFLLGYLRRLLPRRPDLKLIITSATIDVERFSKHFDEAPVIEVSGRTYPVDIRYRPVQGDSEDDRDRGRGEALLDAVDELAREGPGDILVFLPGEREIRETAELLRKHHPPATEILPLYGRLSAAQQQQVFRAHKGRRIVLSTNVAETSLTVPGIRYVIDTGLVRISRYSYRTKVQRLPIEPVSQASANQRAGRCGRVGPGICIRLYSEEDFTRRPAFTDPEILRTNLAAVILQMLSLKLGQVEDFPFINPPDPRYVRDGFKLLHELHAVDDAQRLTDLGRKLARLPVDVRLGRMLLAAQDEQCLAEVLIIVSALGIQDPRERPMDKAQAADEKQRQFRDEQSDFLAYLKLWEFFQEQSRHLSQNKLRKLCQQLFLSYVRLREWREIHGQLKGLVKDMQLKLNDAPADYAAVHRALLTGLLGNVAFKSEEREYTGARGIKLHIFPGSGLVKKAPKWLMAAELVETGRRYARTVAAIEPQWVEAAAEHLVKRSYEDPHWEKKRGHVVAYERVTLYGLVLTARRKVNYSRINAAESRPIFIEGALVRGELQGRYPFLAHNRRLMEEVLDLEAKSRRRDVLVDEVLLAAFFEERLPAHICSVPQFDRWYRQASPDEQQALQLTQDDLMQHDAAHITDAGFPERLNLSGLELELHYHFDPNAEDDGVTLVVPAVVIKQIPPLRGDWLVPGLLEEKVVQLIRSLPKALRRHFVPAPDFARAFMQTAPVADGALVEALAAHLKRLTGVDVPADAWRLEQLPAHLFMNYRVIGEQGEVLAEGRNLVALQNELGAEAAESFAGLAGHPLERADVSSWDFAALPPFVELERQGLVIRGYPALVREDDRLAVRLLDDPERAEREHQGGLIELFRRTQAKSVRYLEKNLPGLKTMCLHFAPVGKCDALTQALVDKVIERALLETGTIRDADTYAERARAAEQALVDTANELCGWVGQALAAYHDVGKRLKGSVSPQWLFALNDIREQLAYLIQRDFVVTTPWSQLRHLGRYLRAVNARLDKLEQNPGRDRQLAAQVAPWWGRCKEACFTEEQRLREAAARQRFRWLVEEYRVSLFAQELGTSEPVSDKRLARAWNEI